MAVRKWARGSTTPLGWLIADGRGAEHRRRWQFENGRGRRRLPPPVVFARQPGRDPLPGAIRDGHAHRRPPPRAVSGAARAGVPAEVPGTLPALQGRPVDARHRSCAGLAMPARPDAIVDLGGDLKKVRFDLAMDDPAGRLVAHRLDVPAKALDLDCPRKAGRAFRLSTGPGERWGLWVAAPPAAAGQAWTITLSHGGMQGGALISTTEKRDDMPIAERAAARHFPNLQLSANRLPTDPADAHALFARLWEAIDVRLLVYSDGADAACRQDEVLLPLEGGEARMVAVKLEGVLRTVPTATLKGSAAAPFVPEDPRAGLPWQLLTDGDALKAWTLEQDHAAIDAFYARVAKFDACFEQAFRAKDSTGKAYEYNLVTYRDGEVVKVENWGSKVAKAAAKKCGADRIEQARDAFEARMRASFRAWRDARAAGGVAEGPARRPVQVDPGAGPDPRARHPLDPRPGEGGGGPPPERRAPAGLRGPLRGLTVPSNGHRPGAGHPVRLNRPSCARPATYTRSRVSVSHRACAFETRRARA